MKLICESAIDVEYLTEKDEAGEKSFFIRGVFMQGNIKNRNGRLYPTEVMEREVNRYVEENVTKSRAFGELGHPTGPTINLDRVSHIIKELHRDGDNFMGKAKITDTPMGQIVKGLMNEGASLGVSSRGMGTLKRVRGLDEVQGDFRLATAADIVAEPSAPDAFVNGIMEGAEWTFDPTHGSWKAERVHEEITKRVKKGPRLVTEEQVELFEMYLESLGR